jgi:hypothetical protein
LAPTAIEPVLVTEAPVPEPPALILLGGALVTVFVEDSVLLNDAVDVVVDLDPQLGIPLGADVYTVTKMN